MTDSLGIITDAIYNALANNTVISALDTAIIKGVPELDTLRTNTIFIVIKDGEYLEERLIGPTDIFACTVYVSYFMKPTTHKYVEGYSKSESDILNGERLSSVILKEMVNALKDVSFSGINVSSYELLDQSLSSPIDSSMPYHAAEVLIKTSYEG